jgi:hypothetical protein
MSAFRGLTRESLTFSETSDNAQHPPFYPQKSGRLRLKTGADLRNPSHAGASVRVIVDKAPLVKAEQRQVIGHERWMTYASEQLQAP